MKLAPEYEHSCYYLKEGKMWERWKKRDSKEDIQMESPWQKEERQTQEDTKDRKEKRKKNSQHNGFHQF